MHGSKEEVLAVRNECLSSNIKENYKSNVLEQNWNNIKPVFPVASGGLQPLMIPELIKIFGNNIILQFGGGIHAHPDGTKAGAKACRQALDAALNNIPLNEALKNNKELKIAAEKWGQR
jgi:ribulose-bisphosphate carboxylase large chain